MSKNLVLLSDGTGQRGGVGYETNIWRLYKALSINHPEQLICYDDGVGSQKSRWSKILGGMAAIGLDQNVRELYIFLVRHWKPGDRIYLFGFSRGAFTVRILADLISRCGIISMHPDIMSEERLTKLVKTAYTASLKAYYHPQYARAFREQFSWKDEAEIQFIGVWDTVGAVGLPFRQARFSMHNFIEYGFRGHALNRDIQYAAHAMSIDDNRETFHPVIWDERIDTSPDRITQAWFSGVHSNIGGGYPKNQLSRVTLGWMIEQLKIAESRLALPPSQRLHFEPVEIDNISREKDPHGRLYNSRSGPAAAFRFLPRDMEEIRHSYTEQKAEIHPAVFDRIKQNTDGYSPHNLTEIFASKGIQQVPGGMPFTNEWCECMKAAKSYNHLQRVVYHLFMLPIIFMLLLMLWKGLLNGLDALPLLTIVLEGWHGPFDSMKELLLYFVSGITIFTVSLIVSEWFQFPLRQRQNRISSQGWSSVFPDCRIDDKALLANAESSPTIRISEALQKIRFLGLYNGVVTLVIYLLVYTLGRIYRAWNYYRVQQPGLKEISTPGSGLIRLATGQKEELCFETSMYRMYTGLFLEKGNSYRISVEKASGWFDAEFEATPDGLMDPENLPDFMKKARELTRLPDTEIFTLLGENQEEEPFRIGSETTYDCTRDGELVLYVNDISLWPFRDFFYLNNRGAARILVEMV